MDIEPEAPVSIQSEKRSTTLLSRLLAFFPAVELAGIYFSLAAVIFKPSMWTLMLLAFVVYGFPLCAFRLHNLLFPVREGVSQIDGKRYSPWWGGHQIQAIYVALPQLEAVLRLIPGAFSLWLRMWGSKVGAAVYWTPRVDIVDRNLLDIGDRVIFGDKVECFGHVIKPKQGRLLLYVKRIHIGHRVFIGAGSRIGPGVHIADGVYVPVLSDLFPNQNVRKKEALVEVSDAI
jgi:hypothetical protein